MNLIHPLQALATAANALPLLMPTQPLAVRAAGAASLLGFSSMALPLCLFALARPLPLILHLPTQAAAVAVMLRRNGATCAVIMHHAGASRQQPLRTQQVQQLMGGGVGPAAARDVVRGLYGACSAAAALVFELVLMLAGQPPQRLLSLLEQPPPLAPTTLPLAFAGAQQGSGAAATGFAQCRAVFTFMQLTVGSSLPLLLLAAAEARLYCDLAAAEEPEGGGEHAPRMRTKWQRCVEAAQRWLPRALAGVARGLRTSLPAQLTAVYCTAVLWLAVDAAVGPASTA